MEKEKKEGKKKLSKGEKTSRNLIILIVVLFILIVGVVIGAYFLIKGYIHKLNYIEDDQVTTAASEVASSIVQKGMDEVIESLTDENGSLLSKEEKESIAKELESIAASQASEVEKIEIAQKEGVLNVLLIGVDTRQNGSMGGNSDSMILCSINHDAKKIVLTSIMRDTYVNIDGYGGNKLNRAHALGGGPLLVQTIENNFRVHIDYYLTVNFFSMINIIDNIGGLDIELKAGEGKVGNLYVNQMCKILGLDAAEYRFDESFTGVKHLNGMQAVSYSRIRYVGNADFERTERQRRVLNLIFAKLKSSDLSTIDKFLNSSLGYITTNMPEDAILNLINSASTYLTYDFQTGNRIPYDNIGYQSYNEMLVTDFTATHNQLLSTIY